MGRLSAVRWSVAIVPVIFSVFILKITSPHLVKTIGQSNFMCGSAALVYAPCAKFKGII